MEPDKLNERLGPLCGTTKQDVSSECACAVTEDAMRPVTDGLPSGPNQRRDAAPGASDDSVAEAEAAVRHWHVPSGASKSIRNEMENGEREKEEDE